MNATIQEMVICPASEFAPGNSEAAIVQLRDGRFLLAFTYFYAAEATYLSPAKISAKISDDKSEKVFGQGD